MSACKRLLFLGLGVAALCVAQVNRATLTGIVTDPSGAVVPSVKVVAIHVDTGTSVSTVTTSAGVYTLPALQIGNYKVEYEAAGFKRSLQSQVTLTAGATVRQDIKLEMGSVVDSVVVSAQASPIETESSRVATNVNTQLVQDLPMLVNGGIRSIFTLASVAPETHGTGQNFRVGGGQAVGWEMLMDGMPMTSGSTLYQGDRASLGSVPVDAINEFTVETSGMKAEYGRSMGAVTFETKSGTNSIHGNALRESAQQRSRCQRLFQQCHGEEERRPQAARLRRHRRRPRLPPQDLRRAQQDVLLRQLPGFPQPGRRLQPGLHDDPHPGEPAGRFQHLDAQRKVRSDLRSGEHAAQSQPVPATFAIRSRGTRSTPAGSTMWRRTS